MKLNADIIKSAVDGIDAISPLTIRSYSGRGMNGDRCIAVSGDNLGDLVTLGASIAYAVGSWAEDNDVMLDDIDSAIPNMRPEVDSLGLGFVAYWRGIPAQSTGRADR